VIWSLTIYTLKRLRLGNYLEFLLGDEMILGDFVVDLLDLGLEAVCFGLVRLSRVEGRTDLSCSSPCCKLDNLCPN
jgi:hypothetical protein